MKALIESDITQELLNSGATQSFRVIDTHGHMGHFGGKWMPNAEPADMIRTMDRVGVEYLVFAHHEALQDPERGNRRAQEAVDQWPDRFLAYRAVNPNYPDDVRRAVDTFSTLRGFVGYKVLAAYYGTPITLPACVPMWQHADAEKLVVLLHTWGGDQCAGWRQIREIAEKYTDAVILQGHSQYGDWDQAIRCARDFPNVYCELCAAYAANGLIQKMVDEGIEDKITFGTDLPWFDPMYGIGCVVFARISDDARRKILRDNAMRIFNRWISRG